LWEGQSKGCTFGARNKAFCFKKTRFPLSALDGGEACHKPATSAKEICDEAITKIV
jgi:hypothetical protein